MSGWRWLWAGGLGLLASAAAASAAYPDGVRPQAVRLSTDEPALRIDGRLDEAVWQRAPLHDTFTQYLPVERWPAPLRTTVQVVVDANGITFGIRAYDPEPALIRAPLVRRDQVMRDQDFVSIVLDPVGARQSAQFVRVNAAGVVADGMFIADTDTEDFAPDFETEAAVQREPDGYSVELRLPLLALRYPYAGGGAWRLMVARSVPRDASMLLLSAPLSKDALNFISELQAVAGLEDVTERVRDRGFLSVRPELTARRTRGAQRGNELSLGADIKWRPRADWVFDATLNPDFSQVELDTPQLAGNTRFALSVPEKRHFFLESTDVLDLPLPAFYSRSVTDPRWGVRATWRGAAADATALSLSDAGGGLILQPGAYGTGVALQDERSQATLLRARWQATQATLGGLVSLRDYGDGRDNRVAGADVSWRAGGQDQLRMRLLGSQTTAMFDPDGASRTAPREDGHHTSLSWWRRTPGWNITAELSDVSPRFRNDNGFVEQAGVRTLKTELIRRFGERELAPLGAWSAFTAYEFEATLALEQRSALRDADAGIAGGETVLRHIHPGLWWVAALNTEAWLQLHLNAERAKPASAGGRLHPSRSLVLGYGVNPAPWFTRFNAEVEAGERLDVDADRVGRGAVWLLEAKLRGGLPNGWGLESEQRVQQGFIQGRDGARALTDTAAQWLGVLHLSARDSLRVLWQHSRLTRAEDATAGVPSQASRDTAASLVAQRRLGVGRVLSAGLSRQSREPLGARETELFVKASFELMP
ncbi:MAG: carbohydrate binding family 9 domain-containing protein [Rhizobacter sp.]|nr:carbohydrate binding family 9 domain-containing protein [Rhizobacter sp.]